jgi:hypothetical protein
VNRKLISGTVLAAGAIAAPFAAFAHGSTPHAAEPSFCAPYQTAVAQFMGEPDPAVIEESLAAMEADIPVDIADAAGIVIETARTAVTSDPSVMDSTPEFFPALGEIDAWMFDNCAFDARLDVLGNDYSFGGLPEEVAAGHVAIRLTNEGTEIHEIMVVRKLEGTTASWEELAPLVAAQDPAVMEQVEFIGGAFSPSVEQPGVAVVDLVPGEYAAICFIPVGTMQGAELSGPEDTESAEGSAPEGSAPAYDPHFAHGMLQEFTVVEAG